MGHMMIQTPRFLARTFKMPVQSNNCKISARLDLATPLLQIITPSNLLQPIVSKKKLTLQTFAGKWFVRRIFAFYNPKVKIENPSQKIVSVQQEGFQETASPKDRQDGSWLSLCQLYQKSMKISRHKKNLSQIRTKHSKKIINA